MEHRYALLAEGVSTVDQDPRQMLLEVERAGAQTTLLLEGRVLRREVVRVCLCEPEEEVVGVFEQAHSNQRLNQYLMQDTIYRVSQLLNEAHYDQAAQELKKAMVSQGQTAELLYLLAKTHYLNRKFSEAINCSGKALELDKTDPSKLELHALIEQKMGNFDKAEESLRQAVEQSSDYKHSMAKFYIRRKRYNQAQQIIDKLLKDDEDDPLLLIQSVQISFALGNMKKTRQGLSHVKRLVEEEECGQLDEKQMQMLKDSLHYYQKSLKLKEQGGSSEKDFDQLQQIRVRLEKTKQILLNNEKKLEELEKIINQLKDQLLWDQQFDSRLKELQKDKKTQKLAVYARGLVWRLVGSIHAYRQLNVGLLEKGQDVVNKSMKELSGKIAVLLELTTMSLPIAPLAKSVIKFLKCFSQKQEPKPNVQKIVAATDKLYTQRHITKEVTLAVHSIINDQGFLKLFFQEKKADNQLSQRVRMYLEFVKEKSITLWTGVEYSEQQLADSHCVQIMAGLVTLNNDDFDPIQKSARLFMRQCLQKKMLKPFERDMVDACIGGGKDMVGEVAKCKIF